MKCKHCYKIIPEGEEVKGYKEGISCEPCHRKGKYIDGGVATVMLVIFFGFIVGMFWDNRKKNKDD